MCEREIKMKNENKLTADKLKRLCYQNSIAWSDGEYEEQEGIFLSCECPKCKQLEDCVFLTLEELPNLAWNQIQNYVIGGKHVTHMTRVVGYYSKTKDWNESKKGELKDRQAGDYSI